MSKTTRRDREAVAAAPATSTFEVFVRMYRALEVDKAGQRPSGERGNLGDCFLIRLVGNGGSSNILIDCGMLLGSTNAATRMQDVARDIRAKTGGTLDLLVVTHEHWDHISGFSQAQEILLGTAADKKDRLAIANLWMAWTENPADAQASALRQRFARGGQSLAALAEYLDHAKTAGTLPLGLDPGQATFGLEGFLGVRTSAGTLQGRDIMERLKTLAGKNVSYLEPGTVLPTPAVSGGPSLRTYVLGPPRDEKKLFQSDPSVAKETYLDTPTFGGPMLRFIGADAAGVPPDGSPFARPYRNNPASAIAPDTASASPTADPALWWYDHYYRDPAGDPAQQAALDRRRIDGDWLAGAGPLALKLDSDTNNTSLALAFDLPDGTVMLFAADAQVGNWLSWHDRSYPDEAGGYQTAEQILNRVRFYKVGHHGSHNATLNEKGLAMMTRPDLVAAIPTDEPLGNRQGKGGWQMPNPRVFDAVRLRTGGKTDGGTVTGGRVFRNDRIYFPENRKPGDIFADDAPEDLLTNLTETDLYLEYQIF